MNIVTLSITSREDISRRAAAAFRGEEQGARISFSSVDLLWKTLSMKRWEILRAMTGQGALSIREVARRVGRDVKAVHGDVTALLHAGILDHADQGGLAILRQEHIRKAGSRAGGSFSRGAGQGRGRWRRGPLSPLTAPPPWSD